jgi:hypothetical protein
LAQRCLQRRFGFPVKVWQSLLMQAAISSLQA